MGYRVLRHDEMLQSRESLLIQEIRPMLRMVRDHADERKASEVGDWRGLGEDDFEITASEVQMSQVCER